MDKIGRFDLNLIVVFDALMTHMNVTKAARAVGLSQPAFSNALGRLRRSIGDPLFVRTAEGMTPTPRAKAMAATLRTAFEDVQRAIEGSSPRSVAVRPVRIAMDDYIQMLFLPSLARGFSSGAAAATLCCFDCCANHRPKSC